jgi:CBS-domain-containing membrane protein
MKPPLPARLLVQITATMAALLATHAVLSFTEHPWLLPSLGGSCVILLGMPRGIMAQPRSFFGGHVLATCMGLLCRLCDENLGGPVAFWLALAVGLALAGMALTRTIHSPAGANPVVAFAEEASLGFILSPLLPGLVTVFLMALLANNLPRPWGAGPWPRLLAARLSRN